MKGRVGGRVFRDMMVGYVGRLEAERTRNRTHNVILQNPVYEDVDTRETMERGSIDEKCAVVVAKC